VAVRAKLLHHYNIEIGAGAGEFSATVWRIGLMGHNARPDIVTVILGALGEILDNRA
jgi:alanine-glyoxylate transaminase/serine-glyoxylate transaminase/serine-pyruvate transaminase